jgi:putative transposase
MGSVGDCFDNAMAESFFATLECELLDRHRFKTQAQAEIAVFDFIEGWCNPHSSIGYLSPMQYPSEMQALHPRRTRLGHPDAAVRILRSWLGDLTRDVAPDPTGRFPD